MKRIQEEYINNSKQEQPLERSTKKLFVQNWQN